MSRKRLVMIVCEFCGGVDYYAPGKVDTAARHRGWIITADRKDFCGADCRAAHRAISPTQ